MKQLLEGKVFYPFPMPTKRMVNGQPVSDSDSDGEESKTDTKAQGVLEQLDEHKKIALVVDTNVLLKQTQLRELLKVKDLATFEDLFEVVTLDTVIGEIKDEKSRAYVDNRLPYTLDVKTAKTYLDHEDIVQVKNFAKDTGDFTSLSEVDQQVIALGVKIARVKKEHEFIRSEPLPLTEFRPANFDAEYKRKFDELASSDSENEEDDSDSKKPSKAAIDSDDEWNNVGDDRKTRRTNQRNAEK